MKKLLSALSVVLVLGLASAQQVAPKSTAPVAPIKEVKMQTAKKAVQVTPTVATAQPKTNNATIKVKKDGTPDKRYKANQKLKKDGTPDKRYKGNK